MNDPAYSSHLAGFEQRYRTLDMNARCRIAGTVLQGPGTIDNGVDPRQMREPAGRIGRLRHVPVHDRRRNQSEMLPATRHGDDLVSLRRQPSRGGRADEACCPYDEDPHIPPPISASRLGRHDERPSPIKTVSAGMTRWPLPRFLDRPLSVRTRSSGAPRRTSNCWRRCLLQHPYRTPKGSNDRLSCGRWRPGRTDYGSVLGPLSPKYPGD